MLSTTSANQVDLLVHSCYVNSCKCILQGRVNSQLTPIQDTHFPIEKFSDCQVFCGETLTRLGVNSPISLDVYAVLEDAEGIRGKLYIPIERWKFIYHQRDDGKPDRSLNRRISVFLRTLFCFVRLLPGFQILQYVRHPIRLKYALYSTNITEARTPPVFQHESLTYNFPDISAQSRGKISVGLEYISGQSLQV